MTKRWIPALCLASALTALLAWTTIDGAPTVLTDPPMESIGALKYVDGVLFAGDSRGGALYALEVGSGPARPDDFTAVGDLDTQIAELLGTVPQEVFVKDLAVDQASGNAFLSVMRGSGADALPALIRITPTGEVEHVGFGSLAYTLLQLADAPEDTGERRNPRASTITDIEKFGDELYIAGLSNEEFASVMRRASYPFETGARATGLEIYHGAHGQWETQAPIYTFMPIDLDGEAFVIAGYLCTPLVAFPMAEMRNADRLRGQTIAELGFANVPIDMLAYAVDGEQYILLTNSRRGTMKITMSDIRAARAGVNITEPVGPNTGIDPDTSPLGLVIQVDKYGEGAILVLERNSENGSLRLSARENRWL